METSRAIPDVPWSEFGLRALDAADQMLDASGHDMLSLRDIAAAAAGTHPAILKQFGSQVGFLAELAARQWDHLAAAMPVGGTDVVAVVLADIAYAIDHPHRFRLMYSDVLWNKRTDPNYRGNAREHLALERMEVARDANFLTLETAMREAGQAKRTRLVAALLTGLSFEFVNERLFQGDRARQLAHAEELVGMVLR